MINSSHSNQLYSSILLLKYLLHLQISLVNPVGPYRIWNSEILNRMVTLSYASQRHSHMQLL